MKLGLLGASGKMGKTVVKEAEYLGIEIFCHARSINEYSKEKVFQISDVVIDFSSHEAAMENIGFAEKYRKPILIATTGHKNMELLSSSKVAVLYAPNTCIEWIILKLAIKNIVKHNPDFIISVDDIHAETKKDAPSGTAKELMNFIKKDADLRSIRKVNLASWHRISLFDTDQIINLEHQVLDRKVYAVGAIKLAQKLKSASPGKYGVEHFIPQGI